MSQPKNHRVIIVLEDDLEEEEAELSRGYYNAELHGFLLAHPDAKLLVQRYANFTWGPNP